MKRVRLFGEEFIVRAQVERIDGLSAHADRDELLARLTLNGWLGVAFLGIFCSGLAYIFWYDALKQIPAAQVGIFLSIEPFVTLVVAGALLGEPFTWIGLLGGIIILAGVWLVNRPAPVANDVGVMEIESRGVGGE